MQKKYLDAPSSRDIVLTEPLIEEVTAEANTDVPDEVVIENTPLEPIVIEAERKRYLLLVLLLRISTLGD